MPTSGRPPLQVEVVTKIPVRNGLNIADPGITGGISRTTSQTAAQTAATRAAVEVVTDVPGQLRNITPIGLGQRAATLGKIGVQVVGKGVGIGLGVLGNLAQDLLFPEPVGVGSDMVNGIKIGQQPKPANTQPTVQPVTKPQVQTQPFRPPRSTVPPAAGQTPAPTKPKPQTSTQTKPQTSTQTPLPSPQNTRAQSSPPKTQPQPTTFTAPSPRAALQTPSLPKEPKPLKTESPYPLNLVDINSYGGVNLNYPIAQFLIGLPEEIISTLRPELEKLDLKLNDLPEEFKNALKNLKLETTFTMPAAIDLTAALPLNVDLKKEVPAAIDLTAALPLNIDLKKEVPAAIDLTAALPLNVDFRKEMPTAIDLTAALPINVDLRKEVPATIDLTAALPLNVDLRKEVPAAIDLTAVLPLNVDLRKEVPAAIDLTAALPLNIDLSSVLKPDEKASGLQDLKKCCESIQEILKKKEEIFQGEGNLKCDNQTLPYTYRGPGLNGIHQLIKIILAANGQILDKICNLEPNIQNSQPLIQGSGFYNCGTLPPIPYSYSGVGLLGIHNQINELFNIDKQILNEVCQIGSSPFGSLPFPQISGQIEYFDCDAQTQTLLYSGNGLEGLSRQLDAVSTLVKTGIKVACDSGAMVIMPDARFEQFKATRQMQITWGTRYPTQQGSLWHSHIPNPKEELNWCKDFENLYHQKGNIYGQVEWANSKIPTGIYAITEEEVFRILLNLVKLSNTQPTLNEFGQPKILIQKGNFVKRKIQERSLRAVRVAISEIGEDGNVSSVRCFTPPPEGCFPAII